jgi:transposase
LIGLISCVCPGLTDVLERMVSGRTKAHELAWLLPWNWKAEQLEAAMNA